MRGFYIILCFVTNHVWAQTEPLNPWQRSVEPFGTTSNMERLSQLSFAYHSPSIHQENENSASVFTSQKNFSMNDQLALTSMIMEEQRTMFHIMWISLIIAVIFGLIIIYSHREKRRIYRSLNELNFSVSEKNEEITRQANKLAEAYENMWKINQRLEEEVNLRTEKIRLQNKKLIEYTNFNSHKIRGPLASILGLLSLMQAEEMSDASKEMLQMLNTLSNELDLIVREFTQRLDSEL